MSGKKKPTNRPRLKKSGKYDIKVKIDASFDQLLQAGLGMETNIHKTIKKSE